MTFRVATVFLVAALLSVTANAWVLHTPKATMKKIASFAGSAAIAASIAVCPVNAKSITQGEQLFQADCAQCHSAIKALPGDQTALNIEALKKYRGGADKATVKDYVQNQLPHSYMPFALKYSDRDYGDVSSYVAKQAK